MGVSPALGPLLMSECSTPSLYTLHTVFCNTRHLTFLKSKCSKSYQPPWPQGFGKALCTCAQTLPGKWSQGSTASECYLRAFYPKFKTSFKQQLTLNNLHQKQPICRK